MAALKINVEPDSRYRAPPSPAWSVCSPTSPEPMSARRPSTALDAMSLPHGDLTARCRALARSFGEAAVLEDPHFDHSASYDPSGAASSPSPGRRSSVSGGYSPLSPTSPRHLASPLFHAPPTPEGSFVLDEILEEEGESVLTPKHEMTSQQFYQGEGRSEGNYGASAPADDEGSYSTVPGGRTTSFAGGIGLGVQQEEHSQEATGARRISSGFGARTDGLVGTVESIIREHEDSLRSSFKEGATWLGVDVWLVDGDLLVGRDPNNLDPELTFSSCFVEPLLRVFKPVATPLFSHHRRRSSAFDVMINPHRPFQLVLRLRTSPSVTIQFVVDALQPLHDASLLTSYCPNARTTTRGLITVVSSSSDGAEMVDGEDLATAMPYSRFIYRDAPVVAFDSDDEAARWNKETHPVAAGVLHDATGWDGQSPLTEEQRERIMGQVERAHKRDIRVRYEGLPNFPVHVRETAKSTLHNLGVDYL
ncbi:hypothetical protein JCM21900_005329 [Sporobolomyces salmonicolor]